MMSWVAFALLQADPWSFRPVVPHPDASIDSFIRARLAEAGLRPSPEADRRTLIRRVTLDLTGLPPTPAEVDAFERDGDYDALVERLLASPRYGERWAQHWLDVVRYGDTHGFEVNTPRPNAWPYRDWVIRAFNDDKPYADFVFEQIAGDAAGQDAATGFLMAGPALLRGQVGKDEPSILLARQDELNEIINATGTAFLGLTLGCARCHDHKFDPIPQADYYAVQAVFAGVRYGERPLRTPESAARRAERDRVAADLAALEDAEPPAGSRPPIQPRLNIELFEPVEARFVRFTVAATNNGADPCIDELEVYAADEPARNVALAGTASVSSSLGGVHKPEHLNDGRVGNARSWASSEPGRGWAQIELPRIEKIGRIVWGRDREGRYLDRVPSEYRIEAAVAPDGWRLVASSSDRSPPSEELRRLQARFAQLRAEPMIFGGTFVEPEPVFRLNRGDPAQRRERMRPGVLRALRPVLELGEETPEQERRVALARWIAHPDNPLPARVLVNRLWHHHFGAGLVDTPSDFGRNGSRPSHPELLDFLAARFVASGGSIKAMHRLIVASATYKQSGAPDSAALLADAQSRLLWRFPPRRLEAEAIRDSVLHVSGALDLKMGGPGFLLFKPNDNYVRVYDAKEEWGPTDWRRMIYSHRVRMAQDGVFGAFDCPDAGLPAPRRSRSTTAIQALNLFNSTFVLQQAELFSRRAGGNVEAAFRLALQRAPTAAERAAAEEVAREHGLAMVCRALFNTSEFLFLP